jgi:hypothetical protein
LDRYRQGHQKCDLQLAIGAFEKQTEVLFCFPVTEDPSTTESIVLIAAEYDE